ncbi:LOW QUALITY PROTEIN: transforming growth factor beta regulator 1 [Rhynchocyon petersi]
MSLLGGLDSMPRSPLQSSKARMKKLPKKSQNVKYRLKYLRLRKAAKATVFENAAICDEIARLEEKFLKAKEERRYLLKKLLQLQALTEGEAQPPAASHTSNLPLTYGVASSVGTVQGVGLISGPSGGAEEPFGKKYKKEKKEKGKENSKLEAAIINDQPGFHDEVAIYPVGYCCTQVTYASMKHPDQKCLCTCQIKDGGVQPQFDIVPEDDPNAIVRSSADACHELLKTINVSMGKLMLNLVPFRADIFGFSNPSIHNLIQSCLGAQKYEQLPNRLLDNDAAAMSFEAFQRQIFEDQNNSILPGSLDLLVLQPVNFVSSYQSMFLT